MMQRAIEIIPEGRSVTQTERNLLALVNERKSLPIEELAGEIGDVRSLISRGYLTLVVSTYVWGLDFQLILTSRGSAELESEESI
jgi:hypothetical protein